MPAGELEHVMSNLLYAVFRVQVLGSNVHVCNPHLHCWVCDYLQQRPAEVGSLCSSPPHPAGRPPHSLCYPAATVARREGVGEGRERGGGGTNQEEEGEQGGRKQARERRCVTLRLGERKSLNWWKPKPPRSETVRALDDKHTAGYTPSLASVCWAYCWCSLV